MIECANEEGSLIIINNQQVQPNFKTVFTLTLTKIEFQPQSNISQLSESLYHKITLAMLI